jgi:flagellar P-ring protein precursor FlgI
MPFVYGIRLTAYGFLEVQTMKTLSSILAAMLLIAALAAPSGATRIKDIAQIEGARPNQLIGYGLVTGLDGSGDSQQAKFTVQSVANMLQKFGVYVPATSIRIKNVAAVMVTCELPPFVRSGQTIDAQVSSIGDAKSLQGGLLLQTPLQAADGRVYGVAQGPVSIGGANYGGGGGAVTKNHPTAGRIVGGVIVEEDVSCAVTSGSSIRILLDTPDFTTASRIAEVVNSELEGARAACEDAGSVRIHLPPCGEADLVPMIARIEELPIEPDRAAVVVVNERTGSIVVGAGVEVNPCAIAHGNIYVTVQETPVVSQPAPLSEGETVTGVETQVSVEEETRRVFEVGPAATIGDVVTALNALGATPRDLIAIIEAMKNAGAIVAKLEVQ